MKLIRTLADWLALMDFRLSRAEFYRDFAEMYQRNEAMVSFLEGEIVNANLTRQRSRARALRLVLHRHQDGEHASRVSHLLEGVVPRSDAMLLTAVDRAADKPQALRALADAIDKQQQMLRLMLSYSALPAMTIPICYALIVVLGKVILVIDDATPVYAQDALWDGINGWAKSLAIFAQAWGTQTLAVLGAALVGVLWSLPRWRGPVRLRVETWPVYSLYRDFQAGMLFSSMAMMLRTGETL
jgi:type II secretory pathway component PulF